MYANIDLANTPGVYYALAYGTSAVLYICLNRKKGSWTYRFLTCGCIWMIMTVFMAVTYRVQLVFFIPCMFVSVCLIFMMIACSCAVPVQNMLFLTAQTFLLGEFAASFEWQMFYFGLTSMDLPLNLWVNLLFLIPCHGVVFGAVYLLTRRAQRGIETPPMTWSQVWPTIAAAAVIFGLSNISYVLKDTPFSSQFTAEIFTIRTLTDLGGVAILFGYYMVSQELHSRQEIDTLQRMIAQQYENYRVSEESIELINRKYHDLKHQIAFLKSGVTGEAKQRYLDEMAAEIQQYEILNQTGNHVVDTILIGKRIRAGKFGIQMTAMVDGAAMSFLSVMDICSLLGNALDNAIEAAGKVEPPPERRVHLMLDQYKGFLRLRVENRFMGTVTLQNGLPAETTKEDKTMHGYGVRSMKFIVEKYDGSMRIETEDNWFRLLILIPDGTRALNERETRL